MASSNDAALSGTYLTTTRLGEKGQITVPKEFRDAFALEAGAPIAVPQLGSGLILIPEQVRFRQLCDRVAQTFARHGIEVDDLQATLPETRDQVFARHYPALAKGKSTRKPRQRS